VIPQILINVITVAPIKSSVPQLGSVWVCGEYCQAKRQPIRVNVLTDFALKVTLLISTALPPVVIDDNSSLAAPPRLVFV
jgi:hypothetical protein